MQRVLCLALLLCSAAAAQAEVLVKLPEEVRGRPGDFLTIKADTECKTVRWVLLDAGPSLLPPELLRDPRTAVLFSLRPGRFRLLAYGAKGDEPSQPVICLLVIEETGPTPPPGPLPPDPKPPSPPMPDQLALKFAAAYKADAGDQAVKAQQLAKLIGLYQAMAESTSDDKTRKTIGDVLGDLKQLGSKMLITDSLIELRKLIAGEVAAVLGTDPAPALDSVLRTRAVEAFIRISKALEQVK